MKRKSITAGSYRTALTITLALAGLLATRQPASAGLSIVGYVNVSLTNGYNFLANPLDAGNNTLTNQNVVFTPPDGTRAYVWNVTSQAFLPTATFRAATGWRDPGGHPVNYDLPVGTGFILHVPTKWTNSFVGNIYQNTYYTNVVAGSNRLSLLGCMMPVAGPLSAVTNAPGFPRLDGATAHFFSSASQSFGEGYTCFTNYGWFDPNHLVSTNGPYLNIAEAFFILNPGSPANWVRIYTNDVIVGRQAMGLSGSSLLGVKQLSVQGGNVTLTISNPDGMAYDVQFSTDGASWVTVATNQLGSIWNGPLPDPVRGCFQVITLTTGGGAK